MNNDPWAEIKALRMQVPPEQTVEPIKPNRLGMIMANILRTGRDWGNKPGKLPEGVPLVGGMGAGDLLMGETPEMTEDWAHGFPPYKGQGMGAVVRPEAIDFAGLPLAGVAGDIGRRGLIKALRHRPEELARPDAISKSRRDFVKGMGATTAVAAGAALAGGLGGKILRGLPGDVATKVAPKVVRPPPRELMKEMVKSFYPDFNSSDLDVALKRLDNAPAEKFKVVDDFLDKLDWSKAKPDAMRRLAYVPPSDYLPESINEGRKFFGLEDNYINIYANGKPTAKVLEESDLAYDIVDALTPEELGNWVISGTPPEKLPKHLHRYVSPDGVWEDFNNKSIFNGNDEFDDVGDAIQIFYDEFGDVIDEMHNRYRPPGG